MVNINEYIEALLHPAGGLQGSHEAHQAGNIDNIVKFIGYPRSSYNLIRVVFKLLSRIYSCEIAVRWN